MALVECKVGPINENIVVRVNDLELAIEQANVSGVRVLYCIGQVVLGV